MRTIISVTEFRRRCLEIVRRVEKTGESVSISRRGKVVARLLPSAASSGGLKPREQLRERGKWLAEPEETFISAADLKGL